VALPGWAEDAVAALYQRHYRPLVRLAALLAGDTAVAEDVVQDCFVALHGGWRRPGPPTGPCRICAGR